MSLIASSDGGGNYCFQEMTVRLKVAITPQFSSQPMEAIRHQISNTLFKYNEHLDGIPLSFSDIQFPPGKEYGKIIADQFWLHVDIDTNLVVFKPLLGQVVRGRVQKVSEHHISILILALFNASISEPELRKSHEYDSLSNSWQSPQGDVKEGEEIDLRILSYQYASGVIHIEGSVQAIQ